jgi:hypothetical protein
VVTNFLRRFPATSGLPGTAGCGLLGETNCSGDVGCDLFGDLAFAPGGGDVRGGLPADGDAKDRDEDRDKDRAVPVRAPAGSAASRADASRRSRPLTPPPPPPRAFCAAATASSSSSFTSASWLFVLPQAFTCRGETLKIGI